MNIFLEVFFEKLNSNCIEYCVLRNFEGLPFTVGNSDLDILVGAKDVHKFYSVIDEVLLLTSGKIVVRYGELTPRLCIVCKNGVEWYGLQIDVHEGILPYKTSSMFPVNYILKNTCLNNGVRVANYSDSDLLAFFKEILNNGHCNAEYYEGARDAWSSDQNYYEELLSLTYSDKFLHDASGLFNGKYDSEKIRLLSIVGRRDLSSGLRIKISNLFFNIKKLNRFLHTPGFTIAFLGTDGAGKTTIIEKLKPVLNSAVHNSLYYEHMRPNVMPNIAQLFGDKQDENPVVNPHGKSSSGGIMSILRLAYYATDYIFGYWYKVYPVLVKKSSIWIFDRYYHDYIIDPKRTRVSLPSIVLKTVGVFIPKPDLVLCLGAKPEAIHSRKPELTLVEVEKHVLSLKSLCDSQSNAFWVDTGGDIDSSFNSAVELIIKKMGARYK